MIFYETVAYCKKATIRVNSPFEICVKNQLFDKNKVDFTFAIIFPQIGLLVKFYLFFKIWLILVYIPTFCVVSILFTLLIDILNFIRFSLFKLKNICLNRPKHLNIKKIFFMRKDEFYSLKTWETYWSDIHMRFIFGSHMHCDHLKAFSVLRFSFFDFPSFRLFKLFLFFFFAVVEFFIWL